MYPQTETRRDGIDSVRVPLAATLLGAGGLIPFVTGTLSLFVLDEPALGLATSMLHGYAVVILAFMGAVHWGLAMTTPSPGAAMAASVVPALAGWSTLALHPRIALSLLALCFAGLYAYDLTRVAAGRIPAWYRTVRTPLTGVVVFCLFVSTYALWQE